jgi:mRNA-degrading endonuclease toxin of MazEF toxin-antitoxin module
MKRGEIYHLKNETGTLGDAGKPRPILIISREVLLKNPYVIIVPINGSGFQYKENLDSCVPLYVGQFGMNKNCVVKCDELRAIPKDKITRNRLGILDDTTIAKVVKAINWCIGNNC